MEWELQIGFNDILIFSAYTLSLSFSLIHSGPPPLFSFVHFIVEYLPMTSGYQRQKDLFRLF